MACLGITGVMCTCPTAALEIFIDIASQHLQIKSTAVLTAYRLRLASNFKAGNLTGQLAILTDFRTKVWTLETPTDAVPLNFDVKPWR